MYKFKGENMFRIGYDAKRLFNNFTGLGNYSRTLLEDLSGYFPEQEYFLFSPEVKKNDRTKPFFDQSKYTIKTASSDLAIWRSFGIKKDLLENRIQLFHGLSHEIPVGLQKTNIKSIVTIHDLIYKHYPQQFPLIDRKIYDWKFRYSCEIADQIVAISESTKKDIIHYYDIPPQKIQVIYQTCDALFKNQNPLENTSNIYEEYQLPKDYLLYVGSIIERKKLLPIIQAIHHLPKDIQLPIVVLVNGKKYKNKVMKYITENNLESLVIFPRYVSFTDFPTIYRNAKMLIYPSIYEGFGIPLIEALFSKTPVITTTLSSLPEAAGSGAHYIEEPSPELIKDGIIKLLSDSDYAKKLAEEGFQYVQRFQSRQLSKEMMDMYRAVLKNKQSPKK
jgi:glycosyltransferase involved in cell wall biosynthesis